MNTPAPISANAGACSYTDTVRPFAMKALAANQATNTAADYQYTRRRFPHRINIIGTRVISSRQTVSRPGSGVCAICAE
jgi:hypothetical protein